MVWKIFYEDLKKKFGQEKRQNHAFFKIKISVKSAFLAKHLDFRVLQKLFYAFLGYIVGNQNIENFPLVL